MLLMMRVGHSMMLSLIYLQVPLPTDDIGELLLLAELAEDPDWLDAELYTVYDYIRCSKRLDLPPGLKRILPVR